MPHNPFRHLAFSIVASALVSSGAFAADTLQCLVFKPLPVAGDGRLDGTVVNACARAVTAYKFELKIHYSDGTSTVDRGGGLDLLPGVAAAAGSGIGALLPGEERTTHLGTLQPAEMQKPIVGTELAAQCVVFDDATAEGDEQELAVVFRDRQDELREWTFWKQSLSKYRDRIASQGPLVSLIDLSNVKTRQRTMSPQHSPLLVEMHANGVRGMLEWADQAVESGKMSRAEAVEWLDGYLAALQTNYAKHSERRR